MPRLAARTSSPGCFAFPSELAYLTAHIGGRHVRKKQGKPAWLADAEPSPRSAQVEARIDRFKDKSADQHDVEDPGLQLDPIALDQELLGEMTEVRLQADNGRVVMPVVPVDMGIIASDIYGLHDEDEAFERIRTELGMKPLITLEWHEDEAPRFNNSLQLLDLGDRTYISISPDPAVAQHWEAIAMVEPGSRDMLHEFFLDLAKDNGSTYSVDLYSALPTRVTSDFLSCDAVGMSFALYLDWDEARSPGAWRFACEYLPRSVEKTPDLVIGSMAVRKEDNEFARRRYINAYAAAVYDEKAKAV